MKRIIFFTLLLCLVTGLATAESIWIFGLDREFTVNYGPNGGSMVGVKYDPAKVKEGFAFFASGEKMGAKLRKTGRLIDVITAEEPALVAATYEEKDGSKKFAKTLFAWSKGLSVPVTGQKLEIVPLQDPFKVVSGKMAGFRVYLDGKPLAGAEIKTNSQKNPAVSQDTGFFEVIRKSGWNYLEISSGSDTATFAFLAR